MMWATTSPKGRKTALLGQISTRRKHAASPFPSLLYSPVLRSPEGPTNFSLSLVSAIDRLAGNDKLKFVGHSHAEAIPPNTFL